MRETIFMKAYQYDYVEKTWKQTPATDMLSPNQAILLGLNHTQITTSNSRLLREREVSFLREEHINWYSLPNSHSSDHIHTINIIWDADGYI